MKSRTSLFNATVLKKDITRFCPLWIIFSVMQVMTALGSIGADLFIRNNFIAYNLAISTGTMAIQALFYALVCALLLFGDLFKGRLCNALHALPVRRESWFATHALAGLLFFLVPNTAMALLFLPFLGSLWFIAPMWLLASTAMFLFFFSLAILCIMLTGSRFATAAIYILINFFSMLCYWLVETYYAPLLPGLHIKDAVFLIFSPCSALSSGEYFRFSEEIAPNAEYIDEVWTYHFQGFTGDWLYVGIVFALSILLFALGLVLYRKRKLESAGNFLAFPKTQPVFLVIFALTIGALFQTFFGLFGSGIVSMVIGMVIGCYAGQMLLRRTVKIFDKRSALWCGILAGAMTLTLVVTAIDPIGLTRWTPEPEQVKSVTISDNYEFGIEEKYDFVATNFITVTDEDDIKNLVSIHESILAQKAYANANQLFKGEIYPVHLTYHMADGREVVRRYYITDKAIYDRLNPYFSTTEFLLGYEDFESFCNDVSGVLLDGEPVNPQDERGLLEAVWADCQAGNLAQSSNYLSATDHYIEIHTESTFITLDIYDYSENIMKWINSRKDTY